MSEHLPVLQVVLPLLAAPLCLLLRSRAVVRAFTLVVVWGSFAIAVSLLRQVLAGGEISYHLGGWPPPLGIEYRVTLFSAFVLLTVTAVASVVLSFGSQGATAKIEDERRYLYYAAFLLAIAGLLGMTITGDAFNVFVFLEISSLSSYSLISMGSSRRSLMAAFSYLIMGTIGGVFVLLGIGMMYVMTGTLNMADLAARLPAVMETRTVTVSFMFLFVGLSIKLAVFPLHQWLPNAYSQAPAKVSAFLAGTATKVSYYLLLRVIFTIFGVGFVFGALRIHYLLVPISLLAMFVGSVAAIYQTELGRLLAYSSIAQVGYMTLGLSFANVDGLTGGVVHLFNHGLTKSGLFLVVACIGFRLGAERKVTIDGIAGIGKRMPLTSAAFVVGGLSLIGVPGTAGFVSKWYLVLGAIERGWIWAAFLILVSSLLAVVYVWRVVEIAYFGKPEERSREGSTDGTGGTPSLSEAPLSMVGPTWILIGATLVFGIWTGPTAGVARQVAEQLLGALP